VPRWLKWLTLTLLAVALVAGGFWWSRLEPPALFGESKSSRVAGGLPVVMPTAGGRLEISTVTVYERFTQENVKKLLGVELHVLGKTVTHLQLKTVYRYHIDMARQWPIERHGDRWVARAGEVQPTLPVAFDTRDLEHYTREGWARFDRQENLVELLRGMSPELETRAGSPQYRQLAQEAGRKTVADFVRNWLLASRNAGDPAKAKVVVLFPGESLERQEQ
jgi:hypothetical protein